MSKLNYDDTIRAGDLVVSVYVKDKVLRVTNVTPTSVPWDSNIMLNPKIDFIEVFDFSLSRILKSKKRKSKTKSDKGWDASYFTKLDQNSIDTLKAKLDELTLLLP